MIFKNSIPLKMYKFFKLELLPLIPNLLLEPKSSSLLLIYLVVHLTALYRTVHRKSVFIESE